MKFIDRIKAAINPQSMDSKFMRALFQWMGNDIPVQYSDDQSSYIKNGYNKNIFVYMVISYIAKNAAKMPWVLKRELPDGTLQTVNEHPLYDLIEKPNNVYTWQHYVEQMIGYYLITGNAYDWRVRVNGGKIKELYYLPSEYMHAILSDKWTDPIKHWELTYYQDVKFDKEEINHFKMTSYTWDNGEWIYGQSPIKSALSVIEQSNETIAAQKTQAANGGAKGILMWDEKTGNGMEAPTEPQLRSFERDLDKKINNNTNRGKVKAIAKSFKYQQLGSASKDLQLLEAHNMSRQDICALYGLDSGIFNDKSASTYNNIQEAKKSAYTEVIIPTLEALMDVWTKSELQGTNLKFYPDTSNVAVLQVDMAKKVDWVTKAWYMGTQWQVEQLGGKYSDELAPYYVPTNLIPSDEADLNNAFGDYQQSQD